MTTLTAKTFLNIILASPAPICQPAFLIFPLSESKLFLSFIWQYNSCPPVPSKILFSRIEMCTSQSVFIYFFFIEDPTSTFSQKGDVQRYSLHGVSGRLFTWAASSCPQKIPERRIAEGNGQHQHTALGERACQLLCQIAPSRAHAHLIFECLKALLPGLCCQCWDEAAEGICNILKWPEPFQTEGCFLIPEEISTAFQMPFLSFWRLEVEFGEQTGLHPS